MKKKTAKKALNESLSRLIESELDKAEVILSIKAFTDKLQEIAEDLAKTEANDIMPMIDVVKEVFGPQVAERFNTSATEAVAQITNAVKAAKDNVSNVVMQLESGLEGGDMTDMSVEPEAPAGDDLEADLGADAEPAADDADLDTDLDADLDADLADVDPTAGDNPYGAGRARKESVERNMKALRESKNPDALIARAFVTNLREGLKPKKAAVIVAESYGIDVADVVEIIKDAKKV